MSHALLAIAQSAGHRPFIDPATLDLHTWWWITLLPLALGISTAYKAVRVPSMDVYLKHVLVMTLQVVAAMILLGVAIHLVVEILVPWAASP